LTNRHSSPIVTLVQIDPSTAAVPSDYTAPFAPGGPAAIDASLAGKLLSEALSRGGDYADLYFEYRAAADYVLEEQRIRTVGRGVTLGLGVRVLRGDATGYAYTEELSYERMAQAARTAAQIAAGGGAPSPVAALPVTLPDFYPVVAPSLVAPGTDKVELLRKADRAARAHDPRIIRAEASLSEEWKEILVVSSDGKLARDRQPLVRFSVRAVAEAAGRRQSGSSGGGARMGLDYFATPGHSPEEHGREAARVAIQMLDAKEAPAGQMEVVLAPGDSGILLHEAVGHGLEADFNRKGTSNYSGRIGQPVASPLVTVVDDGTIAKSRGSIHIDDEGNVSRRNVLIENGILRGYLQDQISARHFSVGPTGSGRRESFKDYIMPRMTNTLMLAGEEHPDDIIRSVGRGIYCISFNGGQVNISNGDFVFSVTEAYLIENGKVTRPIRNVNLIGNGPDVLSSVTKVGSDYALSDGRWMCGKDGQSVPVGVGMPTVLISAMTVGGTKVG
jgi:TldD protein